MQWRYTSQVDNMILLFIVLDGTSHFHFLRDDAPTVLDSNHFDLVVYSIDASPPLSESTEVVSFQKVEVTELEVTPAPPAPTSWNCQLCTFCNHLSSQRCEMCGTENPHRIVNDDDVDNIIEAQDNNPATPADFAVWMCGQCTFMNQMDSLRYIPFYFCNLLSLDVICAVSIVLVRYLE